MTSIIEAAERAAAALIDGADANAKRYLEEAEAEADRVVAARLEGLIETTDSLVEQAEAVRLESERLLETLRRTGARIEPGQEAATSLEEPALSRGKHLSAVPSEPESAGNEPRRREAEADDLPQRSDGAAGARLLATQMAVSGSSRKEIEARLRSGFEIEDTGAILEAILGPED